MIVQDKGFKHFRDDWLYVGIHNCGFLGQVILRFSFLKYNKLDFKQLEFKNINSQEIAKTPAAVRSKVLKNLKEIIEDPEYCKDFLEDIGIIQYIIFIENLKMKRM